jgi:hypothetical protein
MCGFSFGGFCFDIIALLLINPHNIQPVHGHFPKEVLDNIPSAIRYLIMLQAILVIVSLLLIQKPPQQAIDCE